MEEVKVGGVFGPTIPVRLTWNELNVFREIKRGPPCKKATETKHILKNVSGYVNGGEMLAIMGGSGSGKTTLLNVLTHRNVRGMDISGSVQVNGDELGQHMTSVSAYVQQEGLFVPTLTVREHLIFQSTLRLPSKLAHKEKIQKADDIIYELGLRKCAYARIGSGTTARGISGGEARRLAFASELLTDPPLFFCDEPTTGLDTCMAENIVQCLQQLANHGKVVICIIHQPASEIFELFNKILLLAEGKTAYIGTRTEALSFFEKAGYLCPLNYNPADFYIETLAVVPTEEEACRKQIKEICDKYNDSEYSSDVEKLLTWDSSKDGEHLKMNGKKGNGSVYKTGWFMQFFVLLWRALRDNFRNPRTTLFKLIQKLVFGVFVGLCFSGTELDQIGVINISGVMFVLLVDNLHMIVIDIVNVLNAEYAIIVREHHTGMYSVGSYYLSRILSFIPTHIIATIFGTIPPYFMAGLRTKLDAFLIALGIVTLAGQVSFAYEWQQLHHHVYSISPHHHKHIPLC